MKILLTNDDGIDAPGLAALEQAAQALGEVTVVAPHQPLSGCGHLTTTARPLEVVSHRPQRFAVNGSPADCVRLGLLHLAPETQWVFSGINAGGNLGVDVFMSGTVAAAREAALFGKPAIALSQYRRRPLHMDWSRAASWANHVLTQLIPRPPPPGGLWNVNFPTQEDCPDPSQFPKIIECPLDTYPLDIEYQVRENQYHFRGKYHERQRRPGTDVELCFSGKITVSQVGLIA